MWDSVLIDFLYITSDLLAGKGIPILFAVTLFNLEPHLLGTMVLIGAGIAGVINVFKTSRPTTSLVIEWGMRFIHLTMSSILSICLLKKLLQHMHPQGVSLGSIPAFWIIIKPMPEKPVTMAILFVLTTFLLYVSLVIHPEMVVDDINIQDHASIQEHTRQLQEIRHLQAISRGEWIPKPKHIKSSPVIVSETYYPIQDTLPSSIYVLILSVYAFTIHGPLYTFTGKYCSPSLLFNRPYAIFICTLTALYRAYFVITIAWMQQNVIHLLLENDTNIKITVWLHIIILILSVNWNVTQVSNNLLSAFQVDPTTIKIKYTIALFAVAYIYQWNNMNNMLTFMCVFQIVTNSLTWMFY